MRGLDNASPWHDRLQNLNGNYLEYIKNLVKKLTGISAEQDRIRRNELTKCNQLEGRARDACRKAVDGGLADAISGRSSRPSPSLRKCTKAFHPHGKRRLLAMSRPRTTGQATFPIRSRRRGAASMPA